jgi:hypothetical protein
MGAMTDDLWAIGDDLADNWIDVWAYECIIYNTLFHTQGLQEEEIQALCDSKLNVLNPTGGVELRDVARHGSIIHLHSARSRDRAIKLMQKLVDQMEA